MVTLDRCFAPKAITIITKRPKTQVDTITHFRFCFGGTFGSPDAEVGVLLLTVLPPFSILMEVVSILAPFEPEKSQNIDLL